MKVNSPSAAPITTAGSKQELPKMSSGGQKENVGDIANRVANSGKPSGRRIAGKGNGALDKDAFFKLMLAQVKNQDPMDPLKNHEMAAQLAQFSSLEQMSNMNDTLKVMQKGQGEGTQFQALDLMGKMVKGDSSKLSRSQGDAMHDLSFNLKGAAQEVNVSVANSSGEVVKTFTLQNLAPGAGKVQWDGKTAEGAVAPPGSYRISVDAKDSAGQRVGTETEFSGKVSGVQFTEAGPIVFIGKKSVPLKDIKHIEEANAQISSQAEAAQGALQRMAPTAHKMGMAPNMSMEQLISTPDQMPNLDLASLQQKLNSVKE